MKKLISTTFILVFCVAGMLAQTLESDPLVRTMREELNYNFEQLKQKPVPAYFMSLRMQDNETLNIVSSFGACQVNFNHSRGITPLIRLGNKELDNYKYNNQGTANPNSRSAQLAPVPLTDAPLRTFRDEIWQETMNRYDIAINNYEDAKAKSKTDAELEDKAPSFSDAPVENYYEPTLSEWKIDTLAWKKKLNKVSMVFKECRLLTQGIASIQFGTTRTYIVNTDGTAVVQNRRAMRIMLMGNIKATDGMDCPLYKDFFGFSEDEMPSEEGLIATAKELVERLLALREAPLADPYTGPAILSGSASGVFFHEIFGHRLESHRMKKGGETFKKMVGERVLPTSFNVYCDPTVQYYNKQPMNGYYLYDDEGVKAQRVHNVENGILKNFLVGRIPIDGFPQSNGHGRASEGNDPVSRQSNLIIETSQPYTDAQLREMLIKEAKKQGKEYGYFFRTVTSGFTLTDYLNAFNVEPVEVYRIYVDGRKDELVRGVNLIGTPLSMFSNIEAAGNNPETFTGQCGAESGWVNVTGTSPMIYVAKIETQRSNASKSVPRALGLPLYNTDPNINKVNGVDEKDVIFKAMEDEMQRTKDSLRLENLPLPYFVDYRLRRGTYVNIGASLGGLFRANTEPISAIGMVHMTLGDQKVTSQLQLEHRGNQFIACVDLDYDRIRRSFYETSDDIYKICLNHLGQKINDLKRNPMPEDDQQIPEVLELPAREYIEPTVLTSMPDVEELKTIATELSAIFADYPQIFDCDVLINMATIDIYRVTSEGQKLRVPNNTITINVNGRIKSADGSDTRDDIDIIANNQKQLPSLEELKQIVREYCELMIKKAAAPAIKEYYVGPMMIEDEAVNEAFTRSVVTHNCMALRDIYKGSSPSSMKLGKRILDTKLNITQLTNTPEYKGNLLFGDYRVDMDGVTPAKSLNIVENGLLKNLLCGRRPAIGALESTGNERLSVGSVYSSCAPGILHITSSETISMSKMKAALIKEAKKSGLDHAYIVKAPKYGWRYLVRVDVKTGAEEIVRVANIPQPSRGDLMHISAVSKEEFVANKIEYTYQDSYIQSSITPKAIIVETMEYTFTKPNRVADHQLQNPAERK